MNIDSISKNIQDNMVENGEIRRTINYLMDMVEVQEILQLKKL